MSLRRRLIVGMLVLAAVALIGADVGIGKLRAEVVAEIVAGGAKARAAGVRAFGAISADVATYTSLRSFLLKRTDSSLEADHRAIESVLPAGSGTNACDGLDRVVPGAFVQLRSRTTGQVVCSTPVRDLTGPPGPSAGPPRSDERPTTPRLPTTISLSGSSTRGAEPSRYFDTPSTREGGQYRVRASLDPGIGFMLVVARPLHDVYDTLRRLLLIELLVTSAALGAIGLLGFWVVRLGLRPLDSIEHTAAEIAAGDLSKRVERAEDRTEVGRLGLALNSMLGQIEAAFKAREASERKLRRFVADASHELRTPLAAVRAYARRLGADEQLWAIAGLVHDLDYERYPDLETGHPRHGVEELRKRGMTSIIDLLLRAGF